MQKTVKIVSESLKKHYLVTTQVLLLLILLFAFIQNVLENNKTIVKKYEIDKVGEVTIYYPSILLRNAEYQKIEFFFGASDVQPTNIEIVFRTSNTSTAFLDNEARMFVPKINLSSLQIGEMVAKSFYITTINSNGADSTKLLVEIIVNGQIVESSELIIRIESQSQFFFRSAFPYILFVLVVSLLITIYQYYFARRSETESDLSRKLEIAESKVEETPDKVKPIWDVARFTLEKYIDRNQQQINLIFVLSLGVMYLSFIIIIVGVYIAIRYPDSFSIAVLTSGVGVITEFIGATFIIMFKSTLQQASNYSKTLERIATIGIAVQILDTLVDDPKTGNLKSKTRSEVVKLLIKNTVIISETDDNDKK